MLNQRERDQRNGKRLIPQLLEVYNGTTIASLIGVHPSLISHYKSEKANFGPTTVRLLFFLYKFGEDRFTSMQNRPIYGRDIAKLRMKLGVNKKNFALIFGCDYSTITCLERAPSEAVVEGGMKRLFLYVMTHGIDKIVAYRKHDKIGVM